jgi:hypothetical protein
MAKKDPRVDDYIEKSAEFARPILKHLRRVIHLGCPQVQETIKWSFPHFDYKDHVRYGCVQASLRIRVLEGRVGLSWRQTCKEGSDGTFWADHIPGRFAS